MVSIYSFRPVYTFLYTIINGNVIASFVQKKKSFEIVWSKKFFFFAHVRNHDPPPPSCTQSYAFGLAPPLPSPFARTYNVDNPNRNSRKQTQICSKLIKTPKLRHRRRSDAFIVNCDFEPFHIFFFYLFLFLNLLV